MQRHEAGRPPGDDQADDGTPGREGRRGPGRPRAGSSRVDFAAPSALAGWLASRADRVTDAEGIAGRGIGAQARAELGLWRMAQETELSRIRLTLAQAQCVADVLNGTVLESAIAAGVGLAFAGCYDAFRLARTGPHPDVSSFGAKHGPDGCDPGKWEQELLDYLGSLGPVADFALRDAISRWWRDILPLDAGQWRDPAGQDDGLGLRADSPEGFAAAGLKVIEEP